MDRFEASFRYGKYHAVVEYLSQTIKAINKASGIEEGRPSLVPLSSSDNTWLSNAAMLASRACVGEEVFANQIEKETRRQLVDFCAEYFRRSNYSEQVWEAILSNSRRPIDAAEVANALRACTLDLAAMANVLARSILLLDAEPPYTVDVFLPFLRRPEDCRNRDGRQRSPLVFAWANRSRMSKSVLVPTANQRKVSTIQLPRSWFKPVWGVADPKSAEKMLSTYLEFDGKDRCVVANGQYFKVSRFFTSIPISTTPFFPARVPTTNGDGHGRGGGTKRACPPDTQSGMDTRPPQDNNER